jgi:dihydropteroate synthase-like protein
LRLLLVTGRRAASRVYEAAARVRELTGWTVDVYVAPIDVAALMPASMLREIVENIGKSYDVVLVSGMIGYRVDHIGRDLGVRVVKGPEDPYDLVVVAEAGTEALRESIERGRFEVYYAAEKWAKLLADHHRRVEGIEICGVKVPVRPPPLVVVAEVYVGRDVERTISRAKELGSRGADVIVAGFGFDHEVGEALTVLRRLSDEVGYVGVDSPNPKLLAEAVRRGYACIALSATLDNRLVEALPKGTPVVLVPVTRGGAPEDPKERVKLLAKLVDRARSRGLQPVADPVLDPPLAGLTSSLVAYYLAGRELPDVPLLAGIANVYELLDADTHGVIAALVLALAEAGVSLLLASEESSKAFMAVTETAIAATMAGIAMLKRAQPKDLGVDLLVVKEKRRLGEHVAYNVEGLDADAIASWRSEPRLEKYQHIIHTSSGRIHDIVIAPGRVVELVGSTARSIYKAIAYLGLARDPEHLAYLGYELCKAELALSFGRSYRQDEQALVPAWRNRIFYSARLGKPVRLSSNNKPPGGE